MQFAFGREGCRLRSSYRVEARIWSHRASGPSARRIAVIRLRQCGEGLPRMVAFRSPYSSSGPDGLLMRLPRARFAREREALPFDLVPFEQLRRDRGRAMSEGRH